MKKRMIRRMISLSLALLLALPPVAYTASEGTKISTIAGTGAAGYSGDGEAATSSQLKDPRGLTVDSSGDVYIADRSNAVVRKVDKSTGYISTVAGTGTTGYSGDGGAATSAQLKEPMGVAIDSSGNVFIADAGNSAIRKVEKSTGIISTVAGTGTAGYSGEGGAATLAQLKRPTSVAFDSDDNMYIADTPNQRIRKVDKLTGIISTVAGTGTANYSGEGGAATSAQLYFPSSVAMDSSGNLYIAENGSNTIRKVDNSTGIISTVAGTGRTGYTKDGQPATLTTMSNVTDVAVDSSGNIYIADTSNHRIRKVDRLTGIMGTVAGTGRAGYSGDGGVATLAQLNYPNGVAVDSTGNVYIADSSNNRIRKVGLSNDASLSNLSLSSGTLSPAFVSGEKSYTASVANSVSSITVTPTVSDSSSAVTVNGTPVTSGSASGAIDLNVGSNNTITVNVTAQDGTSKQTYTVTVERKPAAATIELTATAGNGQVALNWSSVSGTVTYDVYQGTAMGFYGSTPVATVSGATYSYTAMELTNGTTYYFAVQASNDTGSISYSNEASSIPKKGNTTIAATDLTIGTDAPVTGAPEADGTNTFNHATAAVTWSNGGAFAPASGTYLSGIAYRTKYVLTAATGYAFDATANAYGKNGAQDLSGQITHLGAGTFTAMVSSAVKTNDTLTIVTTWPATFQNLVKVNLDNTTYFQAYYNGITIPAQGVNIAGGDDFGIELANTSVSPSQLKPVVVKSITAVDDKGNNVLVNLTPDTTQSAWGLNLNIKGNSPQTSRTVTITVITDAAYSIDKSFLTSFTGTVAYADSLRNGYPNQYNAAQYFTAGDKLTLSLSSNAVIPNVVQLVGTKTSKVVELTNTLFDTTNYKFQYTFTMPNEPVSVVVNSSNNANAPHNINDGGGSSLSPSPNNSTSNTASQNSDGTKNDDRTTSSGVVKSTFKDVHLEAPWAEQAIEEAYALGLINGRSVDIFDPNSNTKRREAITILVRAMKLDLGLPADLNKAALHFADWDSVPEWSKPSIAAAYVNGLISGSKVNGKFYVNSNSNITRAELAVIIQNAFKLNADMNNVKSFSDDIPSWASESIAALSSNKAVSGYPDGTFKPNAYATRAEVVVMLINVIKP